MSIMTRIFQFHKGTIKAEGTVGAHPIIPTFNSIKVQLRLLILWIVPVITIYFQFHKGTIKAFLHSLPNRSRDAFNSIKVQLRLVNMFRHRKLHRSFNSIKVQLRLMRLAPMPFPTFFQFHKGTIKAYP